jgi:hypothetical protein
MKIKYLECVCHSPEHTLRFEKDDECIYTAVYLNQDKNLFKRVWVAIKYIFGYKCKFGHWDCFILKEEDKEDLVRFLAENKEKHL